MNIVKKFKELCEHEKLGVVLLAQFFVSVVLGIVGGLIVRCFM